jgi:hypothetical protein
MLRRSNCGRGGLGHRNADLRSFAGQADKRADGMPPDEKGRLYFLYAYALNDSLDEASDGTLEGE